MTSNNYLSFMKNVFGFESFLSDDQEKAFKTINEGQHKNIFISLKCQGGKSFCYQLQGALQKKGIILVISPSLVVIKTQLAYLKRINLVAESINGEVNYDDRDEIMNELRSDDCIIKFFFVTPNMICDNKRVRDLLDELIMSGKFSHCFLDDVAKDEDFRPLPTELAELRKANNDIPWIVLATVSKNDIQALEATLGMVPSITVKGSSVRSDIFYSVVTSDSEDKLEQAIIEDIIRMTTENNGVTPRGLIYVSMNDWVSINSLLKKNGIEAKPIYAKLENRDNVQRKWSNGEFPVLVATREYFGYGISFDFAVDFVFHKDSAVNMNSFYQESGRSRGTPEKPGVSKIHRCDSYMFGTLDMISQYEITTGCRRRLIESHFDDIAYDKTVDCGSLCDNCVLGNR